MYYVTPAQEKWLLANGLKPYCPEKGVTLLEAAQFISDKYGLYCVYNAHNANINPSVTKMIRGEQWTVINSQKICTSIPEALSWAIDQAINHVNNQTNGE